jgi:hypothetical protein
MVLMGILWQYLAHGFFSSAMIALPIAAAVAGIVWKVKSR